MAVVIVVEGAIAAGKSTLLSHLARDLRARGLIVAVAQEPVDAWKKVGILKAFYDNPAQMIYPFQTFTCVTRIISMRNAYVECMAEHGRVDVLVSERSPLTDRHVFMQMHANVAGPMLMEMYSTWWGEWMRLVPPEICQALASGNWYEVWLQSSINCCMERFLARARAGECVSLEYQTALHEAHSEFLLGQHAPVARDHVVIVGSDLADRDFRECPDAITQMIIAATGADRGCAQ